MENDLDRTMYTVQEVAQIMKVKPTTVMTWLKTAKLGGFKLSDAPKSEWRIPGSSLDNFIEKRTKQTKQEVTPQNTEDPDNKKMA